MSRVKIFKKDGSPTAFFWMDKDVTDRTKVTVYKETKEGVKKMRGVQFDAVANQMNTQP